MSDCKEPSAALRALVHGDCLRLARRRRQRWAGFAVVSLAFAGLPFLFFSSRSPDLGTWTHGLVLAGYTLGGLGLTALAFGVALPSGRRLFALGVSALVAGVAALSPFVRSDAAEPADAVACGTTCLGTGAGVSAALLVAAFAAGRAVLRRHAPTGLLLGAGAGLLGLVPLHLTCAWCSPAHVLLWHGAVPVASGLAAALGWAMLRSGRVDGCQGA